ncbi:MAG: hypothetical protein NT163_05780 [Chlorobiales bacterium]|nr:hypothetical protein [Chlorobiales bacterium]
MNAQIQRIIDQIEAGKFKEAHNDLNMMRKDPTLSEEIVEVVEMASIEIGVTEKRKDLEPKGGFYAKSAVLRLQEALGDPDAGERLRQLKNEMNLTLDTQANLKNSQHK